MNQYSDLLSELSDFIYPRNPYYGDMKSEYLEFNAQLQDFSQRVNYISCLQTGGKLSSEEARNVEFRYKSLHIQLW
ncbi:MAG: hypothetical protein ACKO11_07745 [Cuspidothrix sp.]